MVSPIEIAQNKRRFEGFRNTPFLWEGLLEGMVMYTTDELSITDYPIIDSRAHIRLGKLTEQFVLFELEQDTTVQLLKANVQVFREKTTIGELDCLIKKSAVNLHLEIVYKFYLYDPSIPSELSRWVGPNQNDSLVMKLGKLREKQMPLLYHAETEKLLNPMNLKSSDFQQKVCFRAQLFTPIDYPGPALPLINNECIMGFYLRYEELERFEGHSYYVPAKLDWLVAPHEAVAWVATKTFRNMVSEQLALGKSPLCWMKSPEGILKKFFVVWWK